MRRSLARHSRRSNPLPVPATPTVFWGGIAAAGLIGFFAGRMMVPKASTVTVQTGS